MSNKVTWQSKEKKNARLPLKFMTILRQNLQNNNNKNEITTTFADALYYKGK